MPRRHPAWQDDVAQDSARSNSVFYMGLAQQFSLLYVFFINFVQLYGPGPTRLLISWPQPITINSFFVASAFFALLLNFITRPFYSSFYLFSRINILVFAETEFNYVWSVAFLRSSSVWAKASFSTMYTFSTNLNSKHLYNKYNQHLNNKYNK